mmetsp:Transcript_19133/g.41696  ORF Transcript_19133/g.41696 Transcript_19133/m.41696 type:complete len:294 (-) Transcript_19133:2180-3061(-)
MPTSTTNSTGTTVISDAAVAREANNEDQYRALFSDLLKKFKDASSASASSAGRSDVDEKTEHYAAETRLIREAARAEMTAIAGGVAVGLTVFVSLRYLPNHLIRWMGGEAKAKALREAEEVSKKSQTAGLQRGVSLFLESSFGLWSGWKGYNKVSSMQNGTYETIARIPLVPGRSALSEGMCIEWTELTYQRVPPAFWKNLEENRKEALEFDQTAPKLKDPRTWEAIRTFAENCLKRDAYEKQIREDRGVDENIPIVIPRPGVPESIVVSSIVGDVLPSTSRSDDLLVKNNAF